MHIYEVYVPIPVLLDLKRTAKEKSFVTMTEPVGVWMVRSGLLLPMRRQQAASNEYCAELAGGLLQKERQEERQNDVIISGENSCDHK